MAERQYLHVAINCEKRPIPEKELEELFSTSLDWIRYAPNCWILWTLTDSQGWYPYLKRILKNDDFFICELKFANRQGWLPKRVWEWIDKERKDD